MWSMQSTGSRKSDAPRGCCDGCGINRGSYVSSRPTELTKASGRGEACPSTGYRHFRHFTASFPPPHRQLR